jgi:hypothetical protein
MYKAQVYLISKNLCDAGVYVGTDNPNMDKKSAGSISGSSSGISINSNMSNMNDLNDVNDSNEGIGGVIHELKVSTVDAFQGSEMDIIIICISKNSGSSFIR